MTALIFVVNNCLEPSDPQEGLLAKLASDTSLSFKGGLREAGEQLLGDSALGWGSQLADQLRL